MPARLRHPAGLLSAFLVCVGLGLLVAVAPAAAVALMVAAMAVALTSRSPSLGVSLWVVLVAVVPGWSQVEFAGIQFFPYFVTAPLVAILLMLGGKRMFSEWSVVDSLVGIGVVAAVALTISNDQERFLWTNVVFALASAYVLGRMADRRAQKTFAITMIALAIWGGVEYVSGWHAFADWQAATGGIGPEIQERAGLARSEATLGHAIAFGACMVAAISFANMLKRPWIWQTVLVLGVLVSISRGPILAAGVVFAAIVWNRAGVRHRLRAAVFLIGSLTVTYLIFTFIYSAAGQGEVQSSSQQRDLQLRYVLDAVQAVGPAQGSSFLPSLGAYVVNGVAIIDNAALRLAVDFGWVVACLLLSPLVPAIWSVLVRKAGPAQIAVFSQIPILLATSFITQWQVFFFFLAGMAVSEHLRRSASQASEERPADDFTATRLSTS